MTNLTTNQIWQAAKQELQLQMTQATFDTWLSDAELVSQAGTTWTIGVKNGYAKDWLEHRLLATIKRTLARISHTTPTIKFVVSADTTDPRTGQGAEPPAACPPPGNSLAKVHPFSDPDLPPDQQIIVELMRIDPRAQWGYTIIGNYEWHFWQPLLALLEKDTGARLTGVAFNVWATLRTFPAHWSHHNRPTWPSIQLLAEICAKGDRNKIIGRPARTGKSPRRPIVGALHILHQQNIVILSSQGARTQIIYRFHVLERLPLLTPTQVVRLPTRLRHRHRKALSRSDYSLEQWAQLILPTLAHEPE